MITAGRHEAEDTDGHLDLTLMVPPPTLHAAAATQCTGVLPTSSDGPVSVLFHRRCCGGIKPRLAVPGQRRDGRAEPNSADSRKQAQGPVPTDLFLVSGSPHSVIGSRPVSPGKAPIRGHPQSGNQFMASAMARSNASNGSPPW